MPDHGYLLEVRKKEKLVNYLLRVPKTVVLELTDFPKDTLFGLSADPENRKLFVYCCRYGIKPATDNVAPEHVAFRLPGDLFLQIKMSVDRHNALTTRIIHDSGGFVDQDGNSYIELSFNGTV